MAQSMEDMGLPRRWRAERRAARSASRSGLDRPHSHEGRPAARHVGCDHRARGAGRPRGARVDAGQEYPGASLEDVDEEAIRRALGRQAVDDLRQLREVERSSSGRAIYGGTAGGWSSPRKRYAGSVRPRCAGVRVAGRQTGRPRHARRRVGRRADRLVAGVAVRRRAAARRRAHGVERDPARAGSAGGVRAGDRVKLQSTTSRSSRPSAEPQPRSACSSTCPAR